MKCGRSFRADGKGPVAHGLPSRSQKMERVRTDTYRRPFYIPARTLEECIPSRLESMRPPNQKQCDSLGRGAELPHEDHLQEAAKPETYLQSSGSTRLPPKTASGTSPPVG